MNTSRSSSLLLLVALCLLSGASAATLFPSRADAEPRRVVIDRIVAKINGEIITLNDLQRASGAHLLARRMTRKQVESSPNSEAIYQEILEDMINTRLLIQEAKELQLEVTEEDVDRWIENVVQSEGASEEQFRDELRSRGIRWRDYRRYIKESLLKVRVVQVKVASRVTVSDAEVERKFTEKFGAPPGEGIKSVDVSHIHIPYPEERNSETMATTEALVARTMKALEGGRPFAELAKEVSAGPMADNGGHLGKFKPGDMRPEYDPIYSLEPGQFTKPIQVESGFHIFKVNETFIDRDPRVDTKLDNIRNQILATQREKELKLWLESLRKRAYVKVMF